MPETPPPRPDDPPIFEFFNEIGIIDQLASNHFERVMPMGLRLPHFSVLNNLSRLGGDKTPAQLANAFQVTKGAMTNTLQRLETAGYVTITPDDEDRRRKRVNITPAGRQARDRAIAVLLSEVEILFADIGETALRRALPTLRRVRQILDAARD